MLFLSHPRFRWLIFATLALTLAFSIALRSTVTAATPGVAPLQLSSDPYTNTTSQHQTEVEPDSYSNGATIVAINPMPEPGLMMTTTASRKKYGS